VRRSIAVTGAVHDQAAAHLLRPDGQEDLCFGLWNPSHGHERQTALIQEIVLPQAYEREVHGNVSFAPEYFERVISEARTSNRGVVLMHSHPAPGWQDMSADDVRAEKGHAAAVFAATDLPLVGMTIGTDGTWSGRFWSKIAPRTFERNWCESVRVVGDKLEVSFCGSLLPPPHLGEELLRTVAAWGQKAQANLARLRVGVIGCGSVGSIIAESLARMGIIKLTLLDYDVIKIHNLDRTLHATRRDALKRRAKVRVLARGIRQSATAKEFEVELVNLSVVEEEGFRRALDCDVLFSCVDRPWPRFVLNFAAYAHLIPVVDGGIRLEAMANDAGLKRATWRSQTVTADHRCLECLGQYDPSEVSLQRAGLLDEPSYIEGLDKNHHLRSSENVFAFSLGAASREVLQFLRMCVRHPGHGYVGAQTEHFVSGMVDTEVGECEPGCPFPAMVAKGDRSGFTTITGDDVAARSMRRETGSGGLARILRLSVGGLLLTGRSALRLLTKRA
jgi:hypothetical protein